MEERDEQWNAEYLSKHGLKQCKECGRDYLPNSGQGKNQKYCSKHCKQKVRGRLDREKKLYKGGYNRHTYIVLWLRARNEKDYTAPCHYCGTRLLPEVGCFVIEHKIPRSKLEKTKEAMHDISNLVISCIPCNRLKGINGYQTFKVEVAGNSELNVPEYKG
jgi:5-methylcytosine-specific restriction endonuclease McrA